MTVSITQAWLGGWGQIVAVPGEMGENSSLAVDAVVARPGGALLRTDSLAGAWAERVVVSRLAATVVGSANATATLSPNPTPEGGGGGGYQVAWGNVQIVVTY
jgi:hypothetical protein